MFSVNFLKLSGSRRKKGKYLDAAPEDLSKQSRGFEENRAQFVGDLYKYPKSIFMIF